MLAATALAGVALLLAACGGGDSTSDHADDFVTQANAVCAAASDELQKATVKAGLDPTKAQLQEFYAQSDKIAQEQLDGLTALTPPDESADQVDAYIEGLRQTLEQSRQDPSSITPAQFQKLADMADAAGLEAECGSGRGADG